MEVERYEKIEQRNVGERSTRGIGRYGDLTRMGGIAGLLAGLSFILAAAALLSGSRANPEEMVKYFPQDRTMMAIGDGLYLITVLALFVLVLALHQMLRKQNPCLALIGSGIGSIGLVALAVGSLPYVAFSKISDAYHASTTTTDEQTSLVLMWQAVQGIFNEVDTVGFMLLAVGFILLSVAMYRSPSFGKRIGGAGVILGGLVLAGMSVFTVDSDYIFPFVLMAFIVIPVMFGAKLIRTSRTVEPEVI